MFNIFQGLLCLYKCF